MNETIMGKVCEARELLSIDRYPGFLYDLMSSDKGLMSELEICLFKEDIDRLSGFIGYCEGAAIICVNYKRPVGHQNMTLAHEMGHFFLHEGVSRSDNQKEINSSWGDPKETEAFKFACELLYPQELFEEDFAKYNLQLFFDENEYLRIAEVIDEICHKYCISFVVVLRKCLFRMHRASEYKSINAKITKKTGGIAKYFDRVFYTADETRPEYQQDLSLYCELKEKLETAMTQKTIGVAVGESILATYDMLEEL